MCPVRIRSHFTRKIINNGIHNPVDPRIIARNTTPIRHQQRIRRMPSSACACQINWQTDRRSAPSPDLIKPAAMNMHGNHPRRRITKTSSDFVHRKTPVNVATTIPISVTAIIGNGLVIQAIIVATKIANKCHAIILIATGRSGVTSHNPISKN